MDDFISVRNKVKPYYTEKRFRHALSVEKEAVKIGTVFLPDSIDHLRYAAILHDITKKCSYSDQLNMCSEFGILLGNQSDKMPKVLHAITGQEFVKRLFPEWAFKDVLSAIRWHTTGKYGMSLFEQIIFLSDCIEETRQYEELISIREEFYSRLACAVTSKDREIIIDEITLKVIDLTISMLIESNSMVEENTNEARNYFVEKLRKINET